MKKILITLAMALLNTSAWAQTVMLPAEPTFTPTNTVSPNASAALASATTNRVFIDQSGNNPNININQIGSGNTFGNVQDPVMLRGNNINLTVLQQGNNSGILLNFNTPLADGTTNLTVKQEGNNNSIDAACGAGNSSNGVALTGCNNGIFNWQFTGNNNNLQFNGTGNDINSSMNVAGNYNNLYFDVIGNKHTQTIMSSGDYNNFNITQNSTGMNGSSILIDHVGNNNAFTIQQSGSIDNVLNIRSAANGGTFNILQRN